MVGRFSRLARVAASVGVCGLVLAVGVGPASAFVPPPPTPSVLTTLLDGVTVSGVASDPLALVGIGAGAYEGTCMLLGAMVSDSSGCDLPGAANSVWNLLTTGTWAGTVPSYSGPTAIVNPSSAWTVASTSAGVNVFAENDGGVVNTTTYLEARFFSRSDSTLTAWQSPNTFYQCGVTNTAILVANANNPTDYISAWNAAVTAAGHPYCADSVGAGYPTTGQAVSQVGVCSAWNGRYGTMGGCVAQWSSGFGAGGPVTATVTETCKAPGGTLFTESASTTYTPIAGAKSPAVALPNCWDITPGSVRVQVGVGVDQGGTTIETRTVPTVDPGIATKYPDCASSKCLLTPEYLPSTTKCFDGVTSTPDADCVDYWPGEAANPAIWRCYWGAYRVPLSYCEDAYPAKFFTTGTRTAPSTGTGTGTGTGTATGTVPLTGTNPGTAPGDAAAADPNTSDCWATGWSWNPVSWVLVPVECALKWAFVPASFPAFGDIASPLPAGWLPSFPTWGAGGCGTVTLPSITLGPLLPHSGATRLFDTCSAPWPLVHTVTYYGMLAVALVTIGNRGFRAVMSALGMAVEDQASAAGYQT
jgi:hypothetical protein